MCDSVEPWGGGGEFSASGATANVGTGGPPGGPGACTSPCLVERLTPHPHPTENLLASLGSDLDGPGSTRDLSFVCSCVCVSNKDSTATIC